MKKTILIVAVTCLSTMGITQKFGHLNAQDVLKDMQEYKDAQTEMERYGEQKQKELLAMQNSLQAEYAKYEKEAPSLSPEIKASREKDIMDQQQSVQQFSQNTQEKIAAKETALLEPMINKVKEAIKRVGKENTFTYIFDISAGSVLYFDGGTDVTDLVKKEIKEIEAEAPKATTGQK